MLYLFDCISIVTSEVTVHALRMRVAEYRTLEGLFCLPVYEFDGHVVFGSQQRVVMKHLQLENKLIIKKISISVELLVHLMNILSYQHILTHLSESLVFFVQL